MNADDLAPLETELAKRGKTELRVFCVDGAWYALLKTLDRDEPFGGRGDNLGQAVLSAISHCDLYREAGR